MVDTSTLFVLTRDAFTNRETPGHFARPRHPRVVAIDVVAAAYLLALWPTALRSPHQAFLIVGVILFLGSALHHWLPHTEMIHRFDQWNIWNYVAVQPLAFSGMSELFWPWFLTLVMLGFVVKVVIDLPARASNYSFLALGVTLFLGLLFEAAVYGSDFSATIWSLFIAGNICYVIQLMLYMSLDRSTLCRDFQHAVLVLGCALHTTALSALS